MLQVRATAPEEDLIRLQMLAGKLEAWAATLGILHAVDVGLTDVGLTRGRLARTMGQEETQSLHRLLLRVHKSLAPSVPEGRIQHEMLRQGLSRTTEVSYTG